MNIDRFLLIAICIAAIVALSGTQIYGVDRTITDTGDDIETFIRNSNGNYWEATGANIQAAIDDIAVSGWSSGVVWIPGDSEIDITESIILTPYITLDLQGSYLNVKANVDGVVMDKGAILTGGTIDTRNYVGEYTKAAVAFDPDQCGANYWTGQTRIQNMLIFGERGSGATHGEGAGIEYRLDSDGEIAFSTSVTTTTIDGFEYSILMNVSGGSDPSISYANGNTFTDITIIYPTYAIYLTRNTSESKNICGVDGNIFDNIILQPGDMTQRVIYAEGRYNIFDNIFSWDWSQAAAHFAYEFPSDSQYQSLRYYGGYYKDEGDRNYITSVAHNDHDRHTYSAIIFQNDTHTFGMNGDTGCIVKQSTDPVDVFKYFCANLGQHYDNIFIKKGIYNVTDSAINGDYASGTTWIGESNENTILRVADESSAILVNIPGKHNITIRDLQFDGNSAAASSHTVGISTGWSSSSANNILVDNCIFKGFDKTSSSEAIIHNAPTSVDAYNIKVINCKFYDNYKGVFFDGDTDPSFVIGCDISHNYFENCNYSIQFDYCNNMTVSHNRIAGGTWGIIIDNTFDSDISSNIIAATNGIDEQGSSDYNIYSNNNCRHCSTPIDINGAGSVDDNNIGTVS